MVKNNERLTPIAKELVQAGAALLDIEDAPNEELKEKWLENVEEMLHTNLKTVRTLRKKWGGDK